MPPDKNGRVHAQYVVYRDSTHLEAGRVPDDPTCHWAAIEGKMMARERAQTQHSDTLLPDDIEVVHVPDAAIFDLPTPPIWGTR